MDIWWDDQDSRRTGEPVLFPLVLENNGVLLSSTRERERERDIIFQAAQIDTEIFDLESSINGHETASRTREPVKNHNPSR